MDAPDSSVNCRGAPRLLGHLAAVDRLTREGELQRGRARLERELGCDLAGLLVGALAPPRGRPKPLSRA